MKTARKRAKTDNKKLDWVKKGLIITPQKDLWWMQTHAMVPFAEIIKDNICKIYFSGRDKNNRSHIGYVLADINNSFKILEYSKEPILTLGSLGCFDDNGVTPSWVVDHDGKKYLYRLVWFKNERPYETGFMQRKQMLRYMKDKKDIFGLTY